MSILAMTCCFHKFHLFLRCVSNFSKTGDIYGCINVQILDKRINSFGGIFFAVADSKAFGLEATSRVKRFVFRFVQVPFRWVFRSRQWHLQLYTGRPYDRLRL